MSEINNKEMNLKKMYSIILCLLFGWGAVAQAQSEADLFNNAMNAYRSGNFQTAQSAFLRALQKHPNGRLITSMRYMLARSYYQAGDFSRAEVVCKYFFNKHPESAYLDDAHHLLGNAYYKQGQYAKAVDEWMWVLDNSKDPRLKKTSENYIYHTMDSFFTRQQVEAVRTRYQNEFVKGIAQILIAKKLALAGENRPAKAMLRSFLQTHPEHSYANVARKLLGSSADSAAKKNIFLYVKDNGSDIKPVADALEIGMKYALDEYQKRNPGSDIGLEAVEVDPTVVSALKNTRDMLMNSNPVCVVGPVDSDQSAALSAVSAYEKRPLVIPLSSQTGLTELSRYAFQINPDASTKGRILGNYAVEDLGLRRLAILAPTNEYGESFVQSFVEAVQAGGGEVESLQWYYEETQDFNRQFRSIWRKGLFLSLRDSVLTENPGASEKAIKRAYRHYLEETFEPKRIGVSVDSTDVPSTGIDGLLLVIRSSEMMQYMAPQVAFNNIQATLLGNEGWNDPQLLRKFRDYLEGMVYITANHFDPDASSYRLFMNRFRNVMKATPDRFHLLGYDIMKWLLSNYSPDMSKDAFRGQLEKSPLYQGVVQSIRFGEKPRVNSKLTVLKLNFGQIIKLQF